MVGPDLGAGTDQQDSKREDDDDDDCLLDPRK
jgi:hypothetical protein